MKPKKNLRRISVLVTAQTAHNLDRLADMCGLRDQGRVIDKLVREKMVSLNIFRAARECGERANRTMQALGIGQKFERERAENEDE